VYHFPAASTLVPGQSLKNRIKAILPPVVTDLVSASIAHYLVHGEYPRLLFPRTFNEMILRRKVFDRRPLLTTFADKLAVREYVADKLGPHVLPRVYLVTNDPARIDFDRLPDRFVVKASHGSGWVRIVWDQSTLDRAELIATCKRWLAMNYYDKLRERAYRNVCPRIMIEEFLDDGSGGAPNDYKFFVFGGEVALIHIVGDRFGARRQSYYDSSWLDTGLKVEHARFEQALPKPSNFESMIGIARQLGADIDFVRVDLYDVGTQVYFGELTSTPGCGLSPFEPRSMDEKLGQKWRAAKRRLVARATARGYASLHSPSQS
jgi:hypothetical protein